MWRNSAFTYRRNHDMSTLNSISRISPRSITGLIIAIVSALAVTVRAQETSPAYSFLNLPSSTLAYGLGGINLTAIEDDINSIDQNPGLLGSEINMQLGVNYMRYVGESNFAGVKFAHRAGEHGAWAMGVQYFGYGTRKGADIFSRSGKPRRTGEKVQRKIRPLAYRHTSWHHKIIRLPAYQLVNHSVESYQMASPILRQW